MQQVLRFILNRTADMKAPHGWIKLTVSKPRAVTTRGTTSRTHLRERRSMCSSGVLSLTRRSRPSCSWTLPSRLVELQSSEAHSTPARPRAPSSPIHPDRPTNTLWTQSQTLWITSHSTHSPDGKADGALWKDDGYISTYKECQNIILISCSCSCFHLCFGSLQQHLRWPQWVLPPYCLWSNQNKLQWQWLDYPATTTYPASSELRPYV